MQRKDRFNSLLVSLLKDGQNIDKLFKYWHAGSKRLWLLTGAKAVCGLMADMNLLAKSVGSGRKSYPRSKHLVLFV